MPWCNEFQKRMSDGIREAIAGMGSMERAEFETEARKCGRTVQEYARSVLWLGLRLRQKIEADNLARLLGREQDTP